MIRYGGWFDDSVVYVVVSAKVECISAFTVGGWKECFIPLDNDNVALTHDVHLLRSFQDHGVALLPSSLCVLMMFVHLC